MKILRYFLFILFLSVILIPLLSLLLWAFAVRWPWPNLLPTLSVANSLGKIPIRDIKALLNGTGISFAAAFVAVFVSLPAARSLAFLNFRGKRALEALILLPLFIPTISIALGVQFSFLKLGISGTIGAVILAQVTPCIPYSIALLRSGFEALGLYYEEQALDLGASRLAVWRDVILPLLLPYLLTSLWMAFLVASGQYLITFYVGEGWIETPTTRLFAYAQNGERRAAALLSMLFLTVCLGLLVILKRISSWKDFKNLKSF